MARFRKGKKAFRTLNRINEGLYPLFVDRCVSPQQLTLSKRYMRFSKARLYEMTGEQENEDTPEWMCACGNYVESHFHCPQCGGEPPWGCDCSSCDDRAREKWVDEDGYDPNFDPTYDAIYPPNTFYP